MRQRENEEKREIGEKTRGEQEEALRFDWSRNALMTQSTKVNFRLHEPEALADFLHVERTRVAPRAHFCRPCLLGS